MTNAMVAPIALIVLASVFQGTFGLGMKRVSPMAWEAWWLIYSVVAMVLVPGIWATLAVPSWPDAVLAAPKPAVWGAMLLGFLWGVGGILFGVSVTRIGISLTYGIVMGLASSVGSLVPLFQQPLETSGPAIPFVLGGVAVMLVGVAVVAWAGIQRERVKTVGMDRTGLTGGPGGIRLGLAIAVLSGLLSALLNVGFAYAASVATAAAQRGALTRNASLAAWLVVLVGAFLMNSIYSVALLVRNRSWRAFWAPGSGLPASWALLTGVLWFAALGVYGQGAAMMGALGPVIGWPVLLGLALVVSNLWAVWAGEWKGATAALRLLCAGVAILIVACGILGYANSLK